MLVAEEVVGGGFDVGERDVVFVGEGEQEDGSCGGGG